MSRFGLWIFLPSFPEPSLIHFVPARVRLNVLVEGIVEERRRVEAEQSKVLAGQAG